MRKLGAASLGAVPTLQVDYDYFDWNIVNGQGRLKQIKAGTPGDPASLLDLRYYTGTNTPEYDAVGNLLNIYDYKSGNPQAQSFGYDALDRLTSAAADGALGAYVETYAYDPATGNLSNKAGVTYGYAAQASGCQGTPTTHSIAQAVSAAGGNSYGYDCNGNMIQRVIGTLSYTLEYDAENRLTTVKQGATTVATFLYDGDGKRVRGEVNGVTTTYIGELAEWSNSVMTRYYYAGSERVALNRGGMLYFLLGDHLGSASIVATSSGGQYSKALFKPWGSDRYTSGTAPTTYRYTGQRAEAGIGLYFYGARWYDSELGRFVQPDSIIPEKSQGVQAWDRYAYVNNNPIRYNDPTGHCIGPLAIFCIAVIEYAPIVIEAATSVLTAYMVADQIANNPPTLNGEQIQIGIILPPGSGLLPELQESPTKSNIPLEPYEVGTSRDLYNRSSVGDDLAIHHAPQGNPASQVFPNYD